MAPTFSAQDFVTQFAKQPWPIAMAKVAAAIGFDKRPISLRGMMATAAPYVPDLTWAPFVNNSQSTPPNWQLVFLWTDDANLPPWDYESSSWSGPPPNKARAATSWQFTLWPPGGSPCIDATVTVANENTAGGVQYIFNGELVGDFEYQITAFNTYGSSTTGKQPVTIPLGSAVPQPAGGQSNYIFYNNCDALTGLTVTLNVTQDIVCQSASGPLTGFSFQLNCLSPTTATTSSQQYVISFYGNQIWAGVQNWSGIGSTLKRIINDSVGLASLSAHGIPAGYKLSISLENDPKQNNNIAGATFTVIDDRGNTLKKYLLDLETYGATAAELAPIVAFQLNLVGPGNSETVVLSSGSGSIVCQATGAGLTVTDSWPCGAAGGTLENASSRYGALTSGPGSLFSQSFSVSA